VETFSCVDGNFQSVLSRALEVRSRNEFRRSTRKNNFSNSCSNADTSRCTTLFQLLFFHGPRRIVARKDIIFLVGTHYRYTPELDRSFGCGAKRSSSSDGAPGSTKPRRLEKSLMLTCHAPISVLEVSFRTAKTGLSDKRSIDFIIPAMTNQLERLRVQLARTRCHSCCLLLSIGAVCVGSVVAQDWSKYLQGLIETVALCCGSASASSKAKSTGNPPDGDLGGQRKQGKTIRAMLNCSIRDLCTFRNQSNIETIVCTTVALSIGYRSRWVRLSEKHGAN
jgi:hypothetical protein